MKKPTVYLDTTVISAYWYEGEDQTVQTRRIITRDSSASDRTTDLETQDMITDSNVEEVRRVREELIKQHGGLDGYMKHLQAMDRERNRTAKKKRDRRTTTRGAKDSYPERRKPTAKV